MNEGQMKDLMKLVWGADPIDNANPRNVGNLLENTLNNNTNAITTALQNNLNAINALTTANQNRTTSKVVDVPFFYGRDDEDPYEWCRLFEAAFAANGWPDNRKIALAAGFLKEAARDWYEENRGNINQWHVDNNANNFDTQFLNYFATAARRNQWTRELQNIKQGDNESVENYSRRFKKLLNKATQGEALAARYQINYYINGLKPFLVGQVVIGNTDTLEATITRAKLVELGVNTTLLTTTPVTTSTIEPIPTTTTTVKPTPQVDEMEALTKQMQQLALNYANLSSVLMVQQSTPRNTRPRPNNNNNQNRQNGQAPTQNSFNPNITCFRCGNVGHISRNCQMGRNTNNGNGNINNNNNNNRLRQRAPVTPINYADDEAEIYYDENEDEYEEEWEEEDEYEAYVTTRSRSVPYEISSPRGKRTRFSESRKEDQLRTQPIPPVTPSTPMDMDATAEPSTKRKQSFEYDDEEEYEPEELEEAQIYMSDFSGYSTEESLEFNPWENEVSPTHQNNEDEELEESNPAIYLAQAEVYNGEKVNPDLHLGPLDYHQQSQFQQLLSDYADICAKSQTEIGKTNVIKHKIITKDATPISQPPYRCNPKYREFLQGEITRMESQRLIRKSASPWASPVVIVDKKGGEKRLCIDYRKLNAVTKADAYPLPRIDDMLESFSNATWFTTLDLASGYWQVAMDPADVEKTAFITPFGLYEFLVMPFGLAYAPGTFQRLMNRILQEYLGKFVAVYLDDHRAGKANANADALSRMFEEDSQTLSCFMISIEKEEQTNVNESSTPVHEEYDADSEDDYTDRPAQRAIDLLNRCDNLIYDMQSYIEERSENNSPINIVLGIRYDFDNSNGPHPEDCICKVCQPPLARSPSPYSCCNEIICQCNEDNYSINTEEYNNSWERQINGEVFSDYSEENQLNIEEHIAWTMCGMDRQAIENMYLENIKIKQVIAGQPINHGGSRCTMECDTENHHEKLGQI
ncbi:retroviral-like aspartic protease 1 [Rhizophagus irregularis DAOM 181602=DAOM 197198]|nr:retroviral-like aspartic protease 1 [Rhizophagus irregularis DAOM 181602=DAOM 197198]